MWRVKKWFIKKTPVIPFEDDNYQATRAYLSNHIVSINSVVPINQKSECVSVTLLS